MRNRNKQICKGLSIKGHRVPKDTLKDKEKIKKEGKNTNTEDLSRDLLKNQRKEKTSS